MGEGEEFFEGREGAGGGGAERRKLGGLGAGRVDRDVGQAHAAGGLAEEGGFALVRLDEVPLRSGVGGGEDEAGKTGAAAEVGEGAGVRREQREELQAVLDVADAPRLDWRWRDQVDPGVPLGQQRQVGHQRRPCFT